MLSYYLYASSCQVDHEFKVDFESKVMLTNVKQKLMYSAITNLKYNGRVNVKHLSKVLLVKCLILRIEGVRFEQPAICIL